VTIILLQWDHEMSAVKEAGPVQYSFSRACTAAGDRTGWRLLMKCWLHAQ